MSPSNVVITPHIGTATQETRSRMWEMSVRNLVAGVRGEDVPYQVV
jgi:glyoxylate reductase